MLRAASISIAGDNTDAAILFLRVFQHKVRSQVSRYDAALAESLIACAEDIIDSIAQPEQCFSRVLFGPTQNEIVLQVKTTFELRDSPNFDQLCTFQSGPPYYWEVNMTALQSPFFGDGSSGLNIAFYTGALEENLSLFIPNSYITNHRAFRITSDPFFPLDDVEGVNWTVSHSESFPMSYYGYLIYDPHSNIAQVNIVFTAGDFRIRR